ncbi:ankyrin repeat-containing domain protein [Aspergillus flavus]|uniref:Ankyrin repeat-containing domain protein n=1 Tax=Aspergillus flavus (strain ATCC 200026 / FGSC A1120 / IAM 13836 / NRRL 3357 / JCM 12722 / SRRC 167) TaxID=332952 RepID=A0A7U2N2F5_ASPFN|nr:uncharacterized protein G4B84_009441 [Aspergillus flavus NRRL3357]KAF7623202.1 hypothetical protein AFLA_010506 [Aspergillus flavus NRRL3357]QMW33975.1 hypothetical protein G4B84_009441 [Aspergillus flavus NRRL3357]QRD94293.1 ankyrin repeat-containing domain protein [Aspergillus flavus]
MANPCNQLSLAIKAGDHPKVTEILDSGLQVATPGHFLLATQKKDYATLKLFLSHGWDINTDIDSLVPSALVYAFEDVELLDWFLDHGADPNKESRIRDCTPLSYAVMEAPFNIVKYLFENGGQLKRGQLLHYAAMRRKDDSYEVLQFIYNEDPDYNELQINKLLDEGTSHHLMNYRSGLGTPLHYAASSGSVDMVSFQLDKGAAHRLDPYHRSPIGYAVYYGHYEVEQVLKARMTLGAGSA